MEISNDYLLDGKIKLSQPVDGYRVAIDPIFLASAINCGLGDTILDVGVGVGAASLCLAHRVPQCRIIGLEVQRPYVRLASENVLQNGFQSRIEIIWGDLQQPPPRLAAGTFAHVMTNPPYLESFFNRSPSEDKSIATHENTLSLSNWIRFCLMMVKPKGTISLIHRADRLSDILTAFHGKVGDIEIYPLWPKANQPAKRIIVKGRKNSGVPLKINYGIVLHNLDGSFTSQADRILRDGQSLLDVVND